MLSFNNFVSLTLTAVDLSAKSAKLCTTWKFRPLTVFPWPLQCSKQPPSPGMQLTDLQCYDVITLATYAYHKTDQYTLSCPCRYSGEECSVVCSLWPQTTTTVMCRKALHPRCDTKTPWILLWDLIVRVHNSTNDVKPRVRISLVVENQIRLIF